MSGPESISMRGLRRRIVPDPPPELPLTFPLRGFELRMKGHLWAAGYRRCYKCAVWDCKVTKTVRLCSECNRNKSKKNYYSEKGNLRVKEYIKSHAESMRKYASAYYKKLVSTPEGREQQRKRWKDQYTKRNEGKRKDKGLCP